MLCRLKFSKSLGADKVRSLIVHPAVESIVVSCGHNHLQQSAFDRIRRRLSRILVLHPYFDGGARQMAAHSDGQQRLYALTLLYTSTESN